MSPSLSKPVPLYLLPSASSSSSSNFTAELLDSINSTSYFSEAGAADVDDDDDEEGNGERSAGGVVEAKPYPSDLKTGKESDELSSLIKSTASTQRGDALLVVADSRTVKEGEGKQSSVLVLVVKGSTGTVEDQMRVVLGSLIEVLLQISSGNQTLDQLRKMQQSATGEKQVDVYDAGQ